MTHAQIGIARLISQQILAARAGSPAEVVAAMGAMQAQDYLGTLWAIGLRMAPDLRASESQVEAAFAERSIVRTWPLRGTLHVVAAADVRWMLELLGPRAIAQNAGRRRQLGIDEATLARSRAVLEAGLVGGLTLTREELFALLGSAGVSTQGQRGIYILLTLAQGGVLCYAARRGKQFTFALLDEWTPQGVGLSRGEALVELARRYFVSHGPASVHDLARWAGLTLADAREGLRGASPELARLQIDDTEQWLSPLVADAVAAAMADRTTAFLLPGFDEFLLGYAFRAAVIAAEDEARVHPGANGVFNGTIVVGGRVSGVWRRTLKARSVHILATPFAAMDEETRSSVAAAADTFGAFLGRSVELEWSGR